MEQELFMQIGVGGIFAILLFREAKDFILQMRDKDERDEKDEHEPTHSDILELLRKQSSKIDALYDWHNVTDPTTGAKIWYVRGSLEDSIKKLNDNIGMQTQVLQQMVNDLKQLNRDVSDIRKGGG